jgi:hypothetical protein
MAVFRHKNWRYSYQAVTEALKRWPQVGHTAGHVRPGRLAAVNPHSGIRIDNTTPAQITAACPTDLPQGPSRPPPRCDPLPSATNSWPPPS